MVEIRSKFFQPDVKNEGFKVLNSTQKYELLLSVVDCVSIYPPPSTLYLFFSLLEYKANHHWFETISKNQIVFRYCYSENTNTDHIFPYEECAIRIFSPVLFTAPPQTTHLIKTSVFIIIIIIIIILLSFIMESYDWKRERNLNNLSFKVQSSEFKYFAKFFLSKL